jgi:pimeloyl-ACP methyl ester carboxylesterase
MTSVAFIKLAGKNATVESPSIVVIPGKIPFLSNTRTFRTSFDLTDISLGGPGGSGVDLLLSYQNIIGQMFGEQYNFVSFDPRGVNNSGLHLDCFSGDANARSAFYQLHRTGITSISSTSLEEQYYSSSIYGDWCNHAVEKNSPHSYYVTTPAVAHDLLAFTEAEAEIAGKSPSTAKLWCYGISYGTVIGSTFASMFPTRIERMILDGVLNADQYYNNYWTDNVDQMDEAMETFSTFCHYAGPQNCSFWGPTPENITARLDGITRQFRNRPVPLSGVVGSNLPTMVTYSDLKTLFLNALYTPLAKFPDMADVLHQVERGNVSGLTGLFEQSNSITDARLTITCTDTYRTNRLTTIEEFKTWVDYTVNKSKYIGDIYPMLLEGILCRSFRPQLPDSMGFKGKKRFCSLSFSSFYQHHRWKMSHRTRYKIKFDIGKIGGLNKPTSFPILFASNTIDPITPLISYVSINRITTGHISS